MSTSGISFKEVGRQAYLNGESAAPALNPAIIEAISDLPVGGGAAEIMRAFQVGWTQANLEQVV